MKRLLPLVVLLAALPARAQVADDSDLAGPSRGEHARRFQAEGFRSGGLAVSPLVRLPRAQQLAAKPGAVTGALLLADRGGRSLPARLASAALIGPGGRSAAAVSVADDGSFELALPAALKGSFKLRFSLDHKLWRFQSPEGSRGYAWESPAFELPAAAGVALGSLTPEPGSENAKVGMIHLTYLDALDALDRLGAGRAWWKRTLAVNWPDDSDYFSPWDFSLHLTRPEAWDVILHELGHAVMAASMNADSAGGQHKIDECYSAALAWSEGWATFFAGVVRLDPADADARFEFLVPRRAPIRLENVPEDVCKGEANEWRVAAALWDLYDSHADGTDASSLPFARLWSAWAGAKMGSLSEYFGLLAPKLSPAELEAARGALTQSEILPAGKEKAAGKADLLAAPDFR